MKCNVEELFHFFSGFRLTRPIFFLLASQNSFAKNELASLPKLSEEALKQVNYKEPENIVKIEKNKTHQVVTLKNMVMPILNLKNTGSQISLSARRVSPLLAPNANFKKMLMDLILKHALLPRL